MLNALGMSGMYGAAEEALMTAMERAIAGLGVGTAVALALGGLVLGAEALSRPTWERRKSGNSRAHPPATRKRSSGAYR